MANYIACDVKGCDEIVRVHIMSDLPLGWRIVKYAMDPETREAQEAYERAVTYSPALRNNVATLYREVVVCPKHELPDFDPEVEIDDIASIPIRTR